MSTSIILLTTANGKQSRHLIPLILSNPTLKVRGLVHSPHSASQLKQDFHQHPNLSIQVGDLLNPNDLSAAMTGVTTVIHVGPPLSVHEPHIGILVIKEAEKAKVKHFIYSSVLHPIRSKLLNHDVKRQVEEYLIESKLNWTILQPTHFMQNSDPKEAVEKGFWPVPYNPDNEMGFIDLRDLAQVIKIILDHPMKHYHARYELCGENMSYTQYAALMSEISGKEVEIRKFDGAEIAKKASKGDADFEDRMNRMFFYYDRWGLVGNSNILEWLLGLGGKCRTLEGYIKDSLEGKCAPAASYYLL